MRIILALLFSALALEAQVTDLRYSNPGVPGISTGDQLYTKTIRDNANTLVLSNQFRTVFTNLNSLTNIIAASASTNVNSYSYTLPATLNWQAQEDALIYARYVYQFSGGTVNMLTNGAVASVAAALSIIYDSSIGRTSLVDAAFWGFNQKPTNGIRMPTLFGRVQTNDNVTFCNLGLVYNGTNSITGLYDLPANFTNTFSLRFLSQTNRVAAGYQFVYVLGYTNVSGSAELSTLVWNSAVFYNAYRDNTANYFQSYGVFPRYFNDGASYFGISEGLIRGNRMFRNAATVIDPGTGSTNISVWVNGYLGMQRASNNIYAASPANRLVIGARADRTNPFHGIVQQWLYFNRALTSNEIVILNRAQTVAAQEIPIVVYGDSISYPSYTDYEQGRNWPVQMWLNLGYNTNYVNIHNHSMSGQTAVGLAGQIDDTGWMYRPYLGNTETHLFIKCGINDIIVSSNSAVTAFNSVSNMWYLGQSNGYIVHAFTILPISTTYGGTYGWSSAKASNINQLNIYIRDAYTNNPYRPFKYLQDINAVVTVSTNTSTDLFDGLHPTNAVHTAIGTYLATNSANWLRVP